MPAFHGTCHRPDSWAKWLHKPGRCEEISEIVRRTKEKICTLGPFTIHDHAGAIKHHNKAKEILIQGYIDLNSLKTRPFSPSRIQTRLESAVHADKVKLDKVVGWDTRSGGSKKTITLHFMDDPTRQPEVLSGSYSRYKQIGWYVFNKHGLEAADIWIRHKGKHQHTGHGLYWEHVSPRGVIEEDKKSLEVDVVDVKARSRYIVALRHDENGQEAPGILGMGAGVGPCCQPDCGTLQTHLRNIWASRTILNAIRLSDNSADILSYALNEANFDNQTHDIYLLWEPGP
ncbi:hypothetical protein CPB86DRAFT_301547 [Serendipita vermifera]|nr:hypothetical protein CPB86DRAFT_301547 [Serendipita vermifera]